MLSTSSSVKRKERIMEPNTKSTQPVCQAGDELRVEGINAKGYGIVSKAAIFDRDLTPAAKGIYGYLCSYTGSGNSAFPTIKKITFDLNLSKDTFYKHFRSLIENGYITVQTARSGGKYNHNIYTIVNLPQKYLRDIPDGYSLEERRLFEMVRKHGLNSAGYGRIAKLPMCDRNLKIETKAMYCFLCALAGASNSAFPSTDCINYYLGICPSTSQSYRKQLLKYGYISVEPRRNNGKFCGYDYYINETIPNTTENTPFSPATNFSETVITEAVDTEKEKPEAAKLTTKRNKRKNNKLNIINPSISHESESHLDTKEGWMELVDYRSKTGHLPYEAILSSPDSIFHFTNTLLRDYNTYTDETMHKLADMIPDAMIKLLSSTSSRANGGTVIPLHVLKVLDRSLESTDSFPYYSMEFIVSNTIQKCISGAKDTLIRNPKRYLSSCLVDALEEGDSFIFTEQLFMDSVFDSKPAL